MTKLTELVVGKRINIFEDSELTKNFIRDNIRDIVDGLSKQFPEPEDSYREFVQNSIDADSPQIEIRHSTEEIDDNVSRFIVTFEDFGRGMSIIERESFFLKLFKSSKENNPIKIGKYGIGISSAFALNLEQFIADSSGYNEETKKCDSWRLHIKDINSDPSYYFQDIEERRGTKITLTRIIRNSEIGDAKKKVHERVSYYCERIKIPLYVNDKLINVPFDLDTSIKVSGSFDGFEYVIGITDPDNAKYELFNNRLKLEEGHSSVLFVEDANLRKMSFLISSNHFRHTFSRESVVKDGYFMNVIKTLDQQKSNLFLKCLEIIQNYDKQIEEIKRPVPPAITIKTVYGSYRILTRYDISSLENRLNTDEQRIGKNFRPVITDDPDEIKNIRFILKDAEKECLEYQRNLDYWRKESEIKKSQVSEAWHYVSDYLEKTKNNAGNREKQFKHGNRIKKILSRKKDFFVILKNLLPSETSQYKIIETLTHGKISISEIIDAFCRNNRLLYLQSKNESMIELITKGGDIAVFDAGYNIYGKKEQENFQDVIIERLFNTRIYDSTYINAYRIYSTTLKTKSYEANDEQADRFIKSVREKLPRNIKIGLNEIYYTKVDMVYEDKPIVIRSRYGSTEKTSKVSFGKKFLRFAIHDTGDISGFDIALVLDNNQIEKLISLYNSEYENLKEFSMHTMGNMITRQHAEFFNLGYRYHVKAKW